MAEKRKNQETFDRIADSARDLVSRGNQRHIVIRDKDGKSIADVTVTTAIIAGIVLFFVPGFQIILIAAVLYGLFAKLRVEIVRDLDDDDETVVIDDDSDDRV